MSSLNRVCGVWPTSKRNSGDILGHVRPAFYRPRNRCMRVMVMAAGFGRLMGATADAGGQGKGGAHHSATHSLFGELLGGGVLERWHKGK